MSLTVNEIPPLFCELDELLHSPTQPNLYEFWKEKARWIRFEEQAEDVAGRWSKPHVATLSHTSIDELKDLIRSGIVILDVLFTDMKEIADCMANELINNQFFGDLQQAQRFAEIMCLQHVHHHEKYKRTHSGSNLTKLSSSGNILDKRHPSDHDFLPQQASKASMKYQYSFTDTILMDDVSNGTDYKENTKFKKKVHTKAEGASVLVAPVDFVKESKLVFLRLDAATELPGLLEVKLKSRFLVLIIGPSDKHYQLYEIGRAMATCLADDVCREFVYAAQNKSDIINAINHFGRQTIVIPPSEWDPKIRIEPPEHYLSKEERKAAADMSEYMHDDENALYNTTHDDPAFKGSKRPFRGLKDDIVRKLEWFSSDFSDFFNLQCVAATLYIYFVSLCSLVAFGGLIGMKTNNNMATMECILAGAVSGILFALFSGQPLNILSATGPMLILESIIYSLCEKNQIEFMEFRLWIGIWTALILFLFVVFNLSCLVKYITRFTEECFASLVATMFIMDAFKSLTGISKKYPVDYSYGKNESIDRVARSADELSSNESNFTEPKNLKTIEQLNSYYPDVYFFSIILFIFTFLICISLKNIRNKPFLPTKVRQIISDFAVLIAILLMSGLDSYVGLNIPKLSVPSDFKPTKEDRDWVVQPFGKNQWWTIILAILPALVATILIFMDQQITAVIVNRKEFKLKKSFGYHLDLLLVSITILLCSILGLPWFVAATVLALTHVNALKVMSENTAPGERPVFLGVREQRLSALLMSILTGLSVFFTGLLKYIPMPVLYAVFLFMGVNALNGMQFIDRLLILFMPAKYQPDHSYLRHVSTKRVHLFTFIQIISTAGLYLIKSIEAVAILFPVLVLATCGIRKLMDWLFSQRELYWLDDVLPGQHVETPQEEENKQAIKHSASSSNDNFFKNLILNKFNDKKNIYKNSSTTEQETMLKSASNNINAITSSTTNSNSIDDIGSDDVHNTASEKSHNDTLETVNEHVTPLNGTTIAKERSVKFVTHFPNIQEDEA